MINYEKETRDAYKSAERAAEYKRYNAVDWTWGRFVTAMAQRAIARELRRYHWTSADQLLDIPCGAGILGKVLNEFPLRIVASDISEEMMALARPEYPADRLVACTPADITATPFARGSFACVVTLSFLHRAPADIRSAALREIAALSSRVVIVSCSVDSPLQRLKHWALSRLRRKHAPAPCPMPMKDVIAECEAHGFRVARSFMVVPALSAYALLVLEKPKT